MSDPNLISRIRSFIHNALPNPLLRTAAVGALGYGATKLAWNPLMDTFKSLARPIALGVNKMSEDEFEDAWGELQNSKALKRWVPIAVGSVAALGKNIIGYNPAYNFDQVYKERPSINVDPGIIKNSSFAKHAAMMEYDGYIPDIDFGSVITANSAKNLFTNDPYLNLPGNSYARQMGTSIIAGAQQQTGTNQLTLGNVFDSAVNKFNSKLTLGGVTDTAVRTIAANGMSQLFTTALDKMVHLDNSTKNKIIDAGTWAGAITSIFD